MKTITPEIVDQVREATDIVDVVRTYLPLKQNGTGFVSFSPFCKEEIPSFRVDPQHQVFKCSSSGHGGDVIGFIVLMEKLTFDEAVRRLSLRAGISITAAD
jgi:DNA primase